MRIDPPPSDAWAMGAIPEDTAAAAPPEDPPGVCSGFQGLRVIPSRSLSVNETVPNSGVVVLPMKMNPADRNWATSWLSAGFGSGDDALDPSVVGQPSTSSRSLIGNGTPKNAGSSSTERADASCSVAARASARARWSSRSANALSAPFSSSTRAK